MLSKRVFNDFPKIHTYWTRRPRLGELVADNSKALSALNRAFEADPRSSYAVTRLATYLLKQGEVEQAIAVFERAFEHGADDRRIHYAYARALLDRGSNGEEGSKVEYHLRRSFTVGDRNYEAQYWYGRQVYVNGRVEDAKSVFRGLGDAPIDPSLKRRVRGAITLRKTAERFTGRVEKLESSYALVSRDGRGDWIFLHVSNVPDALWDALRVGTRLKFSIGFTFRGAAAVDPQAEA